MTETDIDLTDAIAAIRRGDLVVYPTETVYGLAADALDSEAIERVFEAKDRPRDKPVSMALPDAEVARDFAHISDREASFCARFLPGPVTVLLERTDRVPDVLVADGDRVGIRVPDHDLSRELARRTGPITSTSANKSGQPSARRVEDIAAEVREQAAVVLDTGETPGTESTVVDVAENDVVRRGARADEIEAWLAEN